MPFPAMISLLVVFQLQPKNDLNNVLKSRPRLETNLVSKLIIPLQAKQVGR